MKILMTGSNGFIGRSICNRLQQEYEVIGVGTKLASNIPNIQYIKTNIESINFISEIKANLDSCDVIVHVAAYVDKDNFNDKLMDVNCKGTSHVLQLAKEMGCKMLVHTSSLPIIGNPLVLPITEEYLPNPNTLYHISKLTAEYIINQGIKFGIKSVNLRIPSPIGIGMNEKTILPIFLKQCLSNQPINIYGKGLRKQNYIDVRDIAEAVISCINNEVEGTYNIATETVISNIDLAKLCIEMTNSISQIILNCKEDPEEKYCWEVSIQKAKKAFNFQPRYTLRDSITNILISWEQEETL